MLDQIEAFEILVDKIRLREQFDAALVAAASDRTKAGYVRLEFWITRQHYQTEMRDGKLFYVSNLPAIKRKVTA